MVLKTTGEAEEFLENENKSLNWKVKIQIQQLSEVIMLH